MLLGKIAYNLVVEKLCLDIIEGLFPKQEIWILSLSKQKEFGITT
jgi:hypothetical protein